MQIVYITKLEISVYIWNGITHQVTELLIQRTFLKFVLMSDWVCAYSLGFRKAICFLSKLDRKEANALKVIFHCFDMKIFLT